MTTLCGCVEMDGGAPVTDHSISSSPISTEYYRVQSGDTVYSIAWAYGLDYRQLITINRLQLPYKVYIGQPLRVKPVRAGVAQPPSIAVAPYRPYKVFAKWRWPVQGLIIKGFSEKSFGNKGIDLGGRLGQPIRAASSGIVVYCGAGIRGYGNLILIKHNQQFLSAYAFNQSNLVKDGMSVRSGQKIATMGRDNSGRVLLHFEIRYNGKPVNPLHYLH